ncbi:hypothetical protein EXIGLDRAFT_503073 [Exidia glandulosa HHB12029]|uniref:Uncharacterized protein n=1 Tax=Exidia glandulosa HHB12029 TaxID=1314781 RepID=A0A166AS07_EXIGL|nr:hypothetical protein EXIGLDRAFT_503073 [Exidia glandulosa HHB12029]
MTQHGLSIGTANGSASQTPTLIHSSPARVPLASVHQASSRRERGGAPRCGGTRVRAAAKTAHRRRGTESFAVAVSIRSHRPDRIKRTLVVRNCKSQTPTQSSSARVRLALGFGSVATRSVVDLNEGEAALRAQAAARTYGRKICRAVGAGLAAANRTICCTRRVCSDSLVVSATRRHGPQLCACDGEDPHNASRMDERPLKAAHFQRTDDVQTVIQLQLQEVLGVVCGPLCARRLDGALCRRIALGHAKSSFAHDAIDILGSTSRFACCMEAASFPTVWSVEEGAEVCV